MSQFPAATATMMETTRSIVCIINTKQRTTMLGGSMPGLTLRVVDDNGTTASEEGTDYFVAFTHSIDGVNVRTRKNPHKPSSSWLCRAGPDGLVSIAPGVLTLMADEEQKTFDALRAAGPTSVTVRVYDVEKNADTGKKQMPVG